MILGVLAVTASTQFINFQRDARINIIESTRDAFATANDILHTKAIIGSDVIEISNDQIVIDMNGDGIATPGDSDGNTIEGKNSPDIRMIAARNITDTPWTVDNHQILKITDISDELVVDLNNNNTQAYIGFDLDGDGLSADDNCRVYYSQDANSWEELWRLKTSGC